MQNNSDKVQDVLMELARVQVAALNAGIEFWKSWINHASEFSTSVNDQLFKASQSKGNTDDIIGNITDSSRKFIREVSTLPGLYSKQFENELSKRSGSAKKTKPHRRAKAKD